MWSPLVARVLPRRLAPVFPTTYSPKYLLLAKAYAKHKHLGFPYHTCVHCKGFAAAAPRRARASFSVPFSGLPLSRPVRIFGLVGLYPTNNLSAANSSLGIAFKRKYFPIIFSYPVLASVFQGYSRPKGRLLTCY